MSRKGVVFFVEQRIITGGLPDGLVCITWMLGIIKHHWERSWASVGPSNAAAAAAELACMTASTTNIYKNQWKSIKINEISLIFTDFGVKQGSYAAAPAALDAPTLIQERSL